MWSHYSDQHKGFCVEYDFKELGLDNQVTRFIFPVIYQEAIFDMKDYMPDSNKEFDNVLKKIYGQNSTRRYFKRISTSSINYKS